MTPPLILGAGPAGAAAALRLAQLGAEPLLIDRQQVPGDALCGGFLSWATIAQIEALGIDAAALGGHRIDRLALFAGGQEIELPLPAPGMGLSRHRLDTLLRAATTDAGVTFRLGHAVRTLTPTAITLDDGQGLDWDSLFLATGKQDVRGAARRRDGADPELGLRLRLPASPARQRLIGGRIELHWVEGGYVGLLLQEDGSANLCMAVRKSRLTAAGGRPLGLIAALADRSPALADRLGDLPADAGVDAIGDVPYGWRATTTWPGLYRLGDQAAVIPSLAGEGIGIALASAEAAVAQWQAQGRDGAERYQRHFARRALLPLRAAAGFRALGRYPALLRVLSATPGAAGLAMRLTRIANA
ncbi:NAD(P)/FAD-dependent oxidoreductase [Sphingobium sp. Ant17]|uniref:NAD(P)/FAD-dependent oxidoreductase n=1 Tax=Sphingobium sp. Ant17 TaxID=1461752 RepID=UPI0004BB82EB|nr:FAD-dependent oxidoreductase [Sphingobium sp. Ant17]